MSIVINWHSVDRTDLVVFQHISEGPPKGPHHVALSQIQSPKVAAMSEKNAANL